MLFMMVMTAPLNKAIEITKTFLKVVETEPPPYLKSRGVYVTYGDEGYKWYNIVEIDDKHISEGLTELMKRTVPFDDIEGVKVKLEILTRARWNRIADGIRQNLTIFHCKRHPSTITLKKNSPIHISSFLMVLTEH